MPEELAAPKAPRKELGLDDSRSNTPQGFPAPGGIKTQNAAASALLGELDFSRCKYLIIINTKIFLFIIITFAMFSLNIVAYLTT